MAKDKKKKDVEKPKPQRAGTGGVGGRKIGQVLIDLGYLDDDQLWDVLEEAKTSDDPVGQVALNRGLITDEQLQQGLAEQFELRILQTEDLKPTPEALKLVPETMSSVYKVLPLTVKDDVLTVALDDPVNLPALDDLRNFLGIKEVRGHLAPKQAIADVLEKCYQGDEESIGDIIQSLQDMPEMQRITKETSIDLDNMMEIQDSAPVAEVVEHGDAVGDQGPRQRHSF